MFKLLEYPDVFLTTLFTEWLGFKAFVRLDSAFCSGNRTEFLKTTSSNPCSFIVDEPHADENRLAIAWIMHRDYSCRSLALSRSCFEDPKERKVILQSLGAKLTSLTLHLGQAFDNDVFIEYIHASLLPPYKLMWKDVAELCPRLSELSLDGDDYWAFDSYDDSFNAFITNDVKLHTLRLELHLVKYNRFAQALCKAPHLTDLRFENCFGLPNMTARNNEYSTSITRLHIERTNDNAFNMGGLFPYLTELTVDAAICADYVENIVTKCISLTQLCLSHTNGLHACTLKNIATHLIHLQRLVLGYLYIGGPSKWFDETDVVSVMEHCKRLHTMHIRGGYNPIDHVNHAVNTYQYPADYTGSRLRNVSIDCQDSGTLYYLTHKCPHLNTLHLYAVTSTTTFDLRPPPVYHSVVYSLHYIRLSNIKTLSLRGYCDLPNVYTIHTCLYNVQELELHTIDNSINDTNVVDLFCAMPNLHTIHIVKCKHVTHTVVHQILNACPTLRSITYTDCNYRTNKVSPTALVLESVVKQWYPNIRHLCIQC